MRGGGGESNRAKTQTIRKGGTRHKLQNGNQKQKQKTMHKVNLSHRLRKSL